MIDRRVLARPAPPRAGAPCLPAAGDLPPENQVVGLESLLTLGMRLEMWGLSERARESIDDLIARHLRGLHIDSILAGPSGEPENATEGTDADRSGAGATTSQDLPTEALSAEVLIAAAPTAAAPAVEASAVDLAVDPATDSRDLGQGAVFARSDNDDAVAAGHAAADADIALDLTPDVENDAGARAEERELSPATTAVTRYIEDAKASFLRRQYLRGMVRAIGPMDVTTAFGESALTSRRVAHYALVHGLRDWPVDVRRVVLPWNSGEPISGWALGALVVWGDPTLFSDYVAEALARGVTVSEVLPRIRYWIEPTSLVYELRHWHLVTCDRERTLQLLLPQADAGARERGQLVLPPDAAGALMERLFEVPDPPAALTLIRERIGIGRDGLSTGLRAGVIDCLEQALDLAVRECASLSHDAQLDQVHAALVVLAACVRGWLPHREWVFRPRPDPRELSRCDYDWPVGGLAEYLCQTLDVRTHEELTQAPDAFVRRNGYLGLAWHDPHALGRWFDLHGNFCEVEPYLRLLVDHHQDALLPALARVWLDKPSEYRGAFVITALRRLRTERARVYLRSLFGHLLPPVPAGPLALALAEFDEVELGRDLLEALVTGQLGDQLLLDDAQREIDEHRKELERCLTVLVAGLGHHADPADVVRETLRAARRQRQRVAAQQLAQSRGRPLPVVRAQPRVNRNDPCPCGSGKKHKKCCGA